MVESAITRRKFMQLAAGAAASLLLGSCNRPLFSDSPAIITPRAAEFTGEFSFYAAQYIPTSARGMGEPVREAMKTLADKWVDLHPEVEFSFILEPPRMTFETWISTQILMGTGPDTFLTSLPFLNSLAANRGSVVLNDYLDSPNPYHKEAERWGASFSDSYFKQTGSHGVLCGVPIDRNATGLYANIDLFAEAGIDLDGSLDAKANAPADWQTLLDWITSLRSVSSVPFSMAASVLDRWLPGILVDQLLAGLTSRFDVLNYHDAGDVPLQEEMISVEEIVMQITCQGWEPFSEPAVKALYDVITAFFDYLPPGAASSLAGTSPQEFIEGKTAMVWDSNALALGLEGAKVPFEWTSLWFPPVTRATSSFAPDPPIAPRDIGGIVNAAGINHISVERGLTQTSLDWLMFITAPENNAAYVNEVPALLPAVRGAELLPSFGKLWNGRLRGMEDPLHTWQVPYMWLGDVSEYASEVQRYLAEYYAGFGGYDILASKSDALITRLGHEVVKTRAHQYSEGGDWDLTHWPCDPVK
ncbi:MAG: extracellular solute-binding protein [Chloroflexi bacterium]|mgnify:CR=1 FL=1|nr:extracellular solute-binding protein [Chloroflexota bacterium]